MRNQGRFVDTEYPDGRRNTPCSVEGCERSTLARTLCDLHYRRWRETGDPLTTRKKMNALANLACPVIEFNRPCGRSQFSKGMCKMHYGRLQRTGSPYNAQRRRGTMEERYWDSVAKGAEEEDWPWTGRLSPDGYGLFDYQGRPRLAHHIAWFLHTGSWVPKGLTLDHVCHNFSGCAGGACAHRRCCNPHHLQVKTLTENVQASHLHPIHKTHCPKGHPYTPENLERSSQGRKCRICRLERNRISREEAKRLR